MSSRELPPPPLIAPMPWKTGPGRAPLTMIVARWGVMAAATSVLLCGLAGGVVTHSAAIQSATRTFVT